MKTSISYLPEDKQKELNDIVEFIRKSDDIPVQMIILFGSYARDTWVEDRYQEDGTTFEYKSDFDLLFIMKDEKTAKNSAYTGSIVKKIKTKVEINTRLSVIFHGIAYFNGELKERNYFFLDIFNEGVVIYDTTTYAVTAPPDTLPKDTRLMKARHYYKKWLNSADGFLRGFDFYYRNREYSLAVFHLHQTAEHLYMGINLVHTDYKPKSHDLIELDGRSREFNKRFSEAFPCRTKEETELFKKLKDAYIDSRYEKDYVISVEELDYLVERVKVLQRLAEELCKEFIIDFAKQIPNISDELMDKIEKTDAKLEGFYEDRERVEIEEQNRIEGIERKSEEKGEMRKSLEIAKKMLGKGIDLESISEITGLMVEEIEKIKKLK